jgi:hypothetical protein
MHKIKQKKKRRTTGASPTECNRARHVNEKKRGKLHEFEARDE